MVGAGGGTGEEGVTVFAADDEVVVWPAGRRIERTATVLFVPDGAQLVFGCPVPVIVLNIEWRKRKKSY
jgi:hypothetical protein